MRAGVVGAPDPDGRAQLSRLSSLFSGRAYAAASFVERRSPHSAGPQKTLFRGNRRRVASVARWWRNDVLRLAVCGNIQPGNIMLVTDSSAPSGERVKVLDFGIAKVQATALHTKTGQMIGTAAFMSPEQIRGSSAIDGRSDVYSLGVLLYLLLAGSPPFPPPKSDIELVTQHLLDPPIPLVESAPDVSAAVVDLVMQMLAKKATERPTMEEVATVLQSLASSAEVSQVALAKALPATLMVSEPATSGTPWPEAATRPSSSSQTTGRSAVTPRRRTAIMVAGITAVAVLIAVGITLLRKGISDPSPVVAVPARTIAAQTDRVPAEAVPSKQGTPAIAPPLSSAGRPSGVTSAAAALPAAGSGVAVDSRSALVKSKSSAPVNRRPLSSNRHGKAASSALPPRTSGRSISPKISNGKTTSTPIIR